MFRSIVLSTAFLSAIGLAVDGLAQNSGKAPPDTAMMCEHPDYLGHCQAFSLKPGLRHVLVPNPHNLSGNISSIALGKGVEVWVFSGPYFTGTPAVIHRDKKSLVKQHPGPSGFETAYNYPYPWSLRLKDIPREVSPGGLALGSADPVTGPVFQDWDNRIRSFIVYRFETVPAGVHTLGLGIKGIGALSGHAPPISRFFPLPEDESKLHQDINDVFDYDNQAILIKVPPSMEVVLYQDTSLKGKRLEIPGPVAIGTTIPAPAFATTGWRGELQIRSGQYGYPDWYPLDRYQFDGIMSSLVVRVRGWNIGMEAPERGAEGDPHRHRAPPATTEMMHVGEVLPVDGRAPTVAEALPIVTDTDLSGLTLEPDTDRPGHNYQDFTMSEPRADNCRAACAADPKCAAFTFVNPGIQGSAAHCWLKHTAAPAKPASCCVSGARKTVN